MTTLLEIKPYIRDYVEENLDSKFEDKVYWLGERRNVPDYPYCTLSAIAENKDKRTSQEKGGIVVQDDSYFMLNTSCLNKELLFYFPTEDTNIFARQKIITRYKTCTITVSIYNGWTEDTTEENIDMDEAKEFAYQQIDNLECAFEDYPLNKKFSTQKISSIRPLHEPVDGGYMYRYEFDLTIGYNEPQIRNKNIGKSVIKEFDNGEREFKVTIQDNDNIIVET